MGGRAHILCGQRLGPFRCSDSFILPSALQKGHSSLRFTDEHTGEQRKQAGGRGSEELAGYVFYVAFSPARVTENVPRTAALGLVLLLLFWTDEDTWVGFYQCL